MRKLLGRALALALIGGTTPMAGAHHSFAVYFDQADEMTVQGRVTAFRFTNPHGTIALEVTDARGQVQQWRAETNAPVVLQRRGWTRTSITAGDTISIRGWRARDGSNYLRIAEVRDAAGTLIGNRPFGRNDD